MFDIFTGGARVLTTDDVGDALISHVRAVAGHGSTEVVNFPGLVDGIPAVASVTVGEGIEFVALHLPDGLTGSLKGEALAVAALRQRTSDLLDE